MHTMVAPVMVLVAWSLVIWLWMYVRRIPAMSKAGIKPQDAACLLYTSPSPRDS